MADKKGDSPKTDEQLFEAIRKLFVEEEFSLRTRPRTRAAVKSSSTVGPTIQTRSRSAEESVSSPIRSTVVKKHTSIVSDNSGSSEEENSIASVRCDYPSVAKFCGNVHGRTDAQKWKAYDVYR